VNAFKAILKWVNPQAEGVLLSTVLTEPQTGKENPHPSTATGDSKPCVAKGRTLGGAEIHTHTPKKKARKRHACYM